MVSMRRKRPEDGTGEQPGGTPHDGTLHDGTLRDGQAPPAAEPVDPAYERFGGVNLGAAFFGWMVAVGMTVLLTAIVGAVYAVVGQSVTVDELQAGADLTTAGIVTGVVLLAVLLVAYYSGGYVAGRMSRFDGGRQGLAVWLLALLFAVLAAVAGWIAGERYQVLDRADLPTLSVTTQDLTVAGVVSLVVVLGGTLLAAMAGGKVGRRYHVRVDRAL